MSAELIVSLIFTALMILGCLWALHREAAQTKRTTARWDGKDYKR